MRYLLDTNICIYLIKKRPPVTLAHFRQHSPDAIGISIITVFELEFGIKKSRYPKKSRNALEMFLTPLNIVNLDLSSVQEAAAIRAHLEQKGQPIGPYDLFIAGLARSQNLILVSNNTKEFERVEGLSLVNWAAE